MPTILLDTGKCTGLGMCESLAPDVFEVGDDGNLIVHTATVGEDRRAEIEQAVDACPTQALSLKD